MCLHLLGILLESTEKFHCFKWTFNMNATIQNFIKELLQDSFHLQSHDRTLLIHADRDHNNTKCYARQNKSCKSNTQIPYHYEYVQIKTKTIESQTKWIWYRVTKTVVTKFYHRFCNIYYDIDFGLLDIMVLSEFFGFF